MGTSPDTLTNLLTLLPTGTYLVFSTLVPIITNNGVCGVTEKVITGVVVFIFTFVCAFSSFTDSYVSDTGVIWYGLATYKGLWNPFFSSSSGIPDLSGGFYTGSGDKYRPHLADYFISILTVISFLSLSLLSTSLTDCFYGGIPTSILKSVPILVNFLVGILFAFAPPARHGVGFALRSSTKPSTAASIPVAGKDLEKPSAMPSTDHREPENPGQALENDFNFTIQLLKPSWKIDVDSSSTDRYEML